MERAASGGAQLITLPNYLGYSLFGMFAPDLPANASLVEVLQAAALGPSARGRSSDFVGALVRDQAQFVYEFYIHLFQSLAERTATWLVPGTTPEVSEGKWFNTAVVVSPYGKLFGSQRQLYPSPHERELGLSAGTQPRVFETDVGRLGLVIGEDSRYPEDARTLASMGANIMIHPAANAATMNEEALMDFPGAVQSNLVFGIQASLIGGSYQGRSAVYGPAEYTSDGSGVLSIAKSDSEEEIVFADLDSEELKEVER